MMTDMTTDIAQFPDRIGSRSAARPVFVKPSYVRRFLYFIEYADWDEIIVSQDEWIDAFCIGVIVVASLYFVPPVFVILFL